VTRGALSAVRLSAKLSTFATERLFPIGVVRTTLPNGRTLTLWSRGDDGVSNHVFWRGWDGYEPATTPLFYRLARRSAVTLDLGANVGFYTLLAAQANPAGRVHAFEPQPTAFERLQNHLGLNQVRNAEAHPVAVGDVDGTADLFVGEAGVPVSSSLSAEYLEAVRRDGPITRREEVEAVHVRVMPIDAFVRERAVERVDLVKLDVESFEPQALRGMSETLRRDRPHVVCEVIDGAGTAGALEEILEPLGYHYYRLTEAGPIPCSTIDGHGYGEANNYLFTPLPPEQVARL
jgi:FkbM family methyltransferase